MAQPEFLTWMEFYKLHPFDDFHRIHRPAALVAHSMRGGEIDPLLEFLEPDRRPALAGLTEADMTTLRAFGYMKGE